MALLDFLKQHFNKDIPRNLGEGLEFFLRNEEKYCFTFSCYTCPFRLGVQQSSCVSIVWGLSWLWLPPPTPASSRLKANDVKTNKQANSNDFRPLWHWLWISSDANPCLPLGAASVPDCSDHFIPHLLPQSSAPLHHCIHHTMTLLLYISTIFPPWRQRVNLCISNPFTVGLGPDIVKSESQSFSHVWLFEIPWTIACPAPLSMEFSRQEHWRRLLFPSPGDLPQPGIEPRSPFFTSWASREARTSYMFEWINVWIPRLLSFIWTFS